MYVLIFLASNAVMIVAAQRAGWLRPSSFWDPPHFLLGETTLLAPVLLATLVMARVEKRHFSDFGLRLADIGKTWEGILWGMIAVCVLIAAIWALGGYTPGGFNVHGS